MNSIPENFPLPVIGFAAFSGTGKTTLLKKLIALLRARQVNVGLIKQSHHDFDIDIPGKDSYELRKAGAIQTLITSPYRRVLIHEYTSPPVNDLAECLNSLETSTIDLVLVEGFKHASFNKIELQRVSLQKPLLYPEDRNIIAIATDRTDTQHPLPVLDLNDAGEICSFIYQHFLSTSP